MKRIVINLLTALLLPMAAMAQNQNIFSVAITPYVSEELSIPKEAQNLLYQRLTQLITTNGLGSQSFDFVLTPNVAFLDKDVTAAPPIKYTVELEVSFYVIGLTEKIIVSEQAFTVKGIGNSESKAVLEAIKSLNLRSPSMRTFINNVRDKITDYYQERIPTLMAKAQMLADRGDYQQALETLCVVPESVDGYVSIIGYMSDLYLRKIDLETEKTLNYVDTLLIKGEIDEALDILADVNPMSTHYAGAKQRVTKIKNDIDAAMAAEADAKAKELEYQMEQEMRARDEQLRIAELQKAAVMTSKDSLASNLGSTLLDCVKDIAVGFITR